MLEVFCKFLCALIMEITIFYINSKIIYTKMNKLKILQIILILLTTIISYILYPISYSGLYPITMFFLYIIIYKLVFKLTIEESIIVCSLMMIILVFSDVLTSLIFMSKFKIIQIRTDSAISIITNIFVSLICVFVINIKRINNQLSKFYKNISNKRIISSFIFLILVVIDFSYLLHNINLAASINKQYIINFLVIIIFIIITYIFIKSRNEYKKLENEYDVLFSYIKNFEEWIEKEQLNRHEYKNQLAVLRCLTTESKVKEKIDEILEDNINIEDQSVTQLKNLPKGGIKGLLYYKSAIAKKYKIKLTTNVSVERKGILTTLSEKQINVLCKLIGIYFDNAIEAAMESKKKIILIEIYELKDKVNFVFSNTFKNHKNMANRNEKGISSKGEGRGNGLYFAAKLIKENDWVSERQDIIDNYYIQEIRVLKPNNIID